MVVRDLVTLKGPYLVNEEGKVLKDDRSYGKSFEGK